MKNYKPNSMRSLRYKHIIIPIALLIISCCPACEKYLDVKPDDKITTPATVKDLQAMLDNSDKMNIKSLCYDEASADDYFMTPENYARVGLRGQAAYFWEPWPNEYTNEWAKASEEVYVSNVCLETTEKLLKTGTSEQELKNVKGSALFYRAFTWLKLLWIHSKAYDETSAKTDLGIVLRETADFNVPSIRSSTEEGYSRVIEDLEQAIDLLPNAQPHAFRPSKAAAHALLARTYLSMRKYDLALEHAEKCLNIKSDLIDYNTINATVYSPFQSYNPEVLFHAEISAFSYFNVQPAYAMVDTTLYQSYNQNDLRKGVFFLSNGKYFSFKGTYLSRATGSNNLFTGIATDEVYLIKAECLTRIGKTNEAMATLNTLMKKRWRSSVSFPAFTTVNNSDALTVILNERRKELVFRGLRWIDIKRLNKEGNQITLSRNLSGKITSLQPNSERFALPIPADIITLAGIQQNPGW